MLFAVWFSTFLKPDWLFLWNTKTFHNHATSLQNFLSFQVNSLLSNNNPYKFLTCIHHRPHVLEVLSYYHTPPNDNESFEKNNRHVNKTLNPFIQTNISMHILHTVLFTFPNVLIRRICITIMSFFFSWLNVWIGGDLVGRIWMPVTLRSQKVYWDFHALWIFLTFKFVWNKLIITWSSKKNVCLMVHISVFYNSLSVSKIFSFAFLVYVSNE